MPVTDIANFIGDFEFKVVHNDGGTSPIIVGKNNVGTYTVTHEVGGDFAEKMKNYVVNYYQDGSMPSRCNYDAYKIVSRQIELVWSENNVFAYNGKSQAPTATVKAGDLIVGDTCEIFVDGQVNVGSFEANARLLNTNYEAINTKCDFVINPRAVDLVWTDNELTYNGKSQAPTASVKAGGLIEGDTCEIEVSDGYVNVGSYTLNAKLSNKNYTIASNAECDFVINPKSITFTWADDVLVYNGSLQTPNAIASGVVDGDTVKFVIDGAAIKAGTGYVARVTGINNTNYIVDNSAMEITKEFSIQKAKNEFVQLDELPDELDKLPWLDGSKPVSKFGDVVVKYFSDADCTQEVNDITKAGKGRYWVVVSVDGTDDYEAISRVFEIELSGSSTNLVGIIAGSVAGGVSLLAIVAVAIVLVIKKKKKA